jgi:hypothetical protein
VASLIAAPSARGAPEEIQVYLDDLTAPGRFGLDVHNNYAFDSSTMPDYPGARPPDHVYRLTPEFYYGLSASVELGLYVLGAFDRDANPHVDGEKLRIKYAPVRAEPTGIFYGLNVEIGRSGIAVAERPWNIEVKEIVGVRSEHWLAAVNLNEDTSVSPRHGAAALEVDTKLGWRADPKMQFGVELYNEIGSLAHLGYVHESSEMLYGVLDTELGSVDLNLGIGRGLTAGSDGWVAKAIVGFRF